MIETYQIIHVLYDNDTAVAPSLMISQVSHTRGNMYKLQTMYSSILENIFIERIGNLWNSLPSLVVETPSTTCFKMRLDKFWSNQNVLYNFKAPFLGTGSRSYSWCDCLVYYVMHIDVDIKATACAHSADTIRYDMHT